MFEVSSLALEWLYTRTAFTLSNVDFFLNNEAFFLEHLDPFWSTLGIWFHFWDNVQDFFLEFIVDNPHNPKTIAVFEDV